MPQSESTPKLRKREIDLLLLSIIRAYEHPDRKSEGDRLASARAALFGESRTSGRSASYDDLALFRILDELRKPELDGLRRSITKVNQALQTSEWETETDRKPKSARAAARQFRELAGNGASDESLEDRLRRKAKVQLTNLEMAQIEALFDPGAPHTRTVITVLNLLKRLGVQSETIWDENA